MLVQNNQTIDNNILETIRSIDTEAIEREYAKDQLGSSVEYINLDAQACFNKRVSVSKLKCMTGFNYHGERM